MVLHWVGFPSLLVLMIHHITAVNHNTAVHKNNKQSCDKVGTKHISYSLHKYCTPRITR